MRYPSIAFYFMEFVSSTDVSIHIGMIMTMDRKYLPNIFNQQHAHANLPICMQSHLAVICFISGDLAMDLDLSLYISIAGMFLLIDE